MLRVYQMTSPPWLHSRQSSSASSVCSFSGRVAQFRAVRILPILKSIRYDISSGVCFLGHAKGLYDDSDDTCRYRKKQKVRNHIKLHKMQFVLLVPIWSWVYTHTLNVGRNKIKRTQVLLHCTLDRYLWNHNKMKLIAKIFAAFVTKDCKVAYIFWRSCKFVTSLDKNSAKRQNVKHK